MDSTEKYTEDSEQSSSFNFLSHTLDLVKAAFPYLDSQSQQTMGLVIKAGELYETVHTFHQEGQVAALSLPRGSIDIEALLNGIRGVCTPKEREIVDMILNLFKMKNMYQTYSVLASAMASQSEETQDQRDGEPGNEEHDETQNKGGLFGMNANPNMMELLESFLTPEQKDTFDNLSMMLNTMQ